MQQMLSSEFICRLAARSRGLCALGLALLMATQLASTSFAGESVASQITAMHPGTRIELRLNDKHKMRGMTGAVSSSGFAFINASTGEQQIAFNDVASVKRVGAKSHTTRTVLIVVGIGVAATATAMGIYLKKCAPFGCGSKPGL